LSRIEIIETSIETIETLSFETGVATTQYFLLHDSLLLFER